MTTNPALDLWKAFYDLFGKAIDRDEKHLIQHVKWYDEVTAKQKTFPMFGSEKFDGNSGILLVGENPEDRHLFSRSGKPYTNVEGLLRKHQHIHNRPGIVLCELYNPNTAREIINGLTATRRKDPLTQEQLDLNSSTILKMFDRLTVDEFYNGSSKRTYPDRHQQLLDSLNVFGDLVPIFPIQSHDNMMEEFEAVTSRGGEGIVMHQLTEYIAGHKGYRCMKHVKEKTFDLKLIAMKSGIGKNTGLASKFVMEDANGKRIEAGAGKGWNHEKMEHAFLNQEQYLGKIFEVYCFDISSKGVLRQPKIGRERTDKTWRDVV